jgi:SAM-dependent methyltransferase
VSEASASLKGWVERRLLLDLRPPGDHGRDVKDRCSVCGAETRQAFNSWLLPAEVRANLGAPPLVEAFTRRETLFCRACLASLRVRRLADVVLDHYGNGSGSIVELVREPGFRELRIAEVNAAGAMHRALAEHPRLAYSEYRPDGEASDVPHEDICRLSYADASFDLVLTSDVLEHVPDYRLALRESRRVLVPGGRHVLTVPLVPSRPRSVARATLSEAGEVVHHLSPEHHGRGSGPFRLVGRRNDYLAFTDFGMDILDELRAAGFEPEFHFLREPDPDSDLAVVVCGRAV